MSAAAAPGHFDGHIHVVSKDVKYSWMEGLEIDHPWGVPDFQRAAAGTPVVGGVFVEVNPDVEFAKREIAWVNEVSAAHPGFFKAAVAKVPLSRGDSATHHLQWLSEMPLVKGVREVFEVEDLSSRPLFLQAMRAWATFDFSFDICCKSPSLPHVPALIQQFPAKNFILDHIAKPSIVAAVESVRAASSPSIEQTAPFRNWADWISKLATFQNLWCKISGVLTEASVKDWKSEHVNPFIDFALATFGSRRCIFGGDWPVVTMAAPYAKWHELVVERVRAGGLDEASIFSKNCAAVYRF